MAIKIQPPNRYDALVNKDLSPTKRTHRFYVELADNIEDLTSGEADDLTIIWASNEPTSSTGATIADGNAPTATETGQAIKNLTTRINALQQVLRDAGLLT